MNKPLYTTAQKVMDFHESLVRTEGNYPPFSKTLMIMNDRGLLSETPLSVPEINGQMSKEEFRQAYNMIPFEATRIINSATPDKIVQESYIFPKGRDVFCVQHMHNFGIGEKYLNKFFEITYIFNGNAILYYSGKEIPLKEGDICIITPDTIHRIHPYADSFAFESIIRESTFNSLFNEFLITSCILSEFFRNALLKKEHENYCIIHTDPDDGEFPFYLQAFTMECINENVYANTCAISLIKLFLSRAFRKYSSSIEISSIDFQNVRPDMDSILQYIRNNYRDVTLTKTADYFHYNRTYLSRFIHSHFHKSFMEIVTELKIESAREYLLNSDRRIADIALLVGYDNADHFSRTFKQHTGMSPMEFRKRSHH
mgnify:CR=1 FL=1